MAGIQLFPYVPPRRGLLDYLKQGFGLSIGALPAQLLETGARGGLQLLADYLEEKRRQAREARQLEAASALQELAEQGKQLEEARTWELIGRSIPGQIWQPSTSQRAPAYSEVAQLQTAEQQPQPQPPSGQQGIGQLSGLLGQVMQEAKQAGLSPRRVSVAYKTGGEVGAMARAAAPTLLSIFPGLQEAQSAAGDIAKTTAQAWGADVARREALMQRTAGTIDRIMERARAIGFQSNEPLPDRVLGSWLDYAKERAKKTGREPSRDDPNDMVDFLRWSAERFSKKYGQRVAAAAVLSNAMAKAAEFQKAANLYLSPQVAAQAGDTQRYAHQLSDAAMRMLISGTNVAAQLAWERERTAAMAKAQQLPPQLAIAILQMASELKRQYMNALDIANERGDTESRAKAETGILMVDTVLRELGKRVGLGTLDMLMAPLQPPRAFDQEYNTLLAKIAETEAQLANLPPEEAGPLLEQLQDLYQKRQQIEETYRTATGFGLTPSLPAAPTGQKQGVARPFQEANTWMRMLELMTNPNVKSAAVDSTRAISEENYPRLIEELLQRALESARQGR